MPKTINVFTENGIGMISRQKIKIAMILALKYRGLSYFMKNGLRKVTFENLIIKTVGRREALAFGEKI